MFMKLYLILFAHVLIGTGHHDSIMAGDTWCNICELLTFRTQAVLINLHICGIHHFELEEHTYFPHMLNFWGCESINCEKKNS